jgi:flagellar hook-basal body complex protein FliE
VNVTDALNALSPARSLDRVAPRTDAAAGGASFGETLKQFVGDVNTAQQNAGTAVSRFVAGEQVDLHEVMIAAEKARTSFDLLMELRNKALDVYRELMRMQV